MKKEKDLKDSTKVTDLTLKDIVLPSISYTKTNKLLTALYIVTDIIDKEEPLRSKLRILGTDIVSDIYSKFSTQNSHLNNVIGKVDEVLSFLEISQNLNLISAMNAGILRKEFLELKESLRTLTSGIELQDLFKEEKEGIQIISAKNSKGHHIGHTIPSRIGVQRGGTLMKALSDKFSLLSGSKFASNGSSNSFDVLKKQRRDEIIKVIKENPANYSNGLTITDIRNTAKDFGEKLGVSALSSCGEKTLQRELFSMVKDSVLKKNGSKRWSRYSLV